MRQSRDRRKAFRRGHMAEYVAAVWLMLKGYRILAMRYKTPLGEIDIIARKGKLIVCVEVKARKSFEQAVFAVSPSAQNRIRAASELWLSRQREGARLSLRYDIIAIVPLRLPRHMAGAF